MEPGAPRAGMTAFPITRVPVRLAELIQQRHFSSPAQEAVLNILATQSWITGQTANTLASFDITPNQYNVLRILRGRHPETHTCSEVSTRLLDRTPDVTRLLFRLERDGLVHRCRAEHDRRVVKVSITEKGLALLERIDAPMAELMDRLTRHLSDDDLQTLSRLLDTLRTDQD